MLSRIIIVSALVAAAALVLFALVPVPHAEACSVAPLDEHVLDPDEEANDVTAPSVPTADPRVTRGVGIDDSDSGCGAKAAVDSCSDTGFINIAVAATDDRTAAELMGYQITLAGGELPQGLTLPVGPVRPFPGGDLHLIFSNHNQDISFTLAIRAVDLGGNLGDPVEVLIEDAGADEGGGCHVGGSAQAMPLALLGLALLFGLRRRRPRAR